MHIIAIGHALPTRCITNDWIEGAIQERTARFLSEDDRRVLIARIRHYLAAAGTTVRYHLDEGERPIDLVMTAAQEALTSAGVMKEDVDFVIYCGVSRGWLEPATAPAIQAAVGLGNAAAFDVLEACAGWLRALQIADSYLRTGTYRRGLIVNCECGMFDRHADWALDSIDTLERKIAAFTIGEAATATLVDDDRNRNDVRFAFRTIGTHAALCMIPLEGAEGFTRADLGTQWSPGRFFSSSRELLTVA